MLISFTCDKVDIGKKRVDGTRVVSLDVGEYETEKLIPILMIPSDNVVKVTLETEA